MSGVFRRCGCRDESKKQFAVLVEKPSPAQLAKACPKMVGDPKHGWWSFRISAGFDPVTKKRVQVNGGHYATKREAQTERNKAAVKVDRGVVLKPSKETVAEYLPKWLERRGRLRMHNRAPLAPNTIETYKRYIDNDITPSIVGSLRLRDVRRQHVQRFIDQLIEDGRGDTTVRRIVAVLQSAFTAAVDENLVETNPARGVGLPEQTPHEFKPWEAEQVRKFLDVAAGHRLSALFEMAMRTGLRRGEILGLKWVDVDLLKRGAFIRNNRTASGDGNTKTAASRDWIPLAPDVVDVLGRWKDAQEDEQARAGVLWQERGYVFTMEDGRPLKPQYATHLFEKLRKQADLPTMTFHGQRHQTAALLIASGEELTTVKEILRHSSGAVTDQYYAHLVESKAHAAVTRASALIPPSTTQQADAHTLHTQGGDQAEEAATAMSGNGLRNDG